MLLHLPISFLKCFQRNHSVFCVLVLDSKSPISISSADKQRIGRKLTRCDKCDDQIPVVSAQNVLMRPVSRNLIPRKTSASAIILNSYAFFRRVLPRRFRCCLLCFFCNVVIKLIRIFWVVIFLFLIDGDKGRSGWEESCTRKQHGPLYSTDKVCFSAFNGASSIFPKVNFDKRRFLAVYVKRE